MNVRVGLPMAAGVSILLFLTACGDGESPSLFARRVQASFDVTEKVTYEVTFDPQGTGNANPVSMTVTQGRWGRRFDSSHGREGMTFSGTFLDLGDEQYMCNRYTGLDSLGLPEDQLRAWEDGVCYTSESVFGDSADELFGPVFDFTFSFREFLKEYDGEVEWEATSSRMIAGINADCYRSTFTDPETGESEDADICFSGDDILLSMDVRSSEGSGASTLLAQEVDRDVQGDDFALPYPVVDRPY